LREPHHVPHLHAGPPRTGGEGCIYPCTTTPPRQSDSIEGITHSICTLEFEDHRPLYDCTVEAIGIYHPQQNRIRDRSTSPTPASANRKLLTLVQDGHVRGWDDPRMPTLSGIRRRGYTPEAIRTSALPSASPRQRHHRTLASEYFVREDLNKRAPRVMAVLRPLKVVIDNYPEGQVEEMEAVNNPKTLRRHAQSAFSKVLYIEQEDFREDPPKEFFRLAPGREVRLRYGYFIKCTGVIKNDAARSSKSTALTIPPPRRQRSPTSAR